MINKKLLVAAASLLIALGTSAQVRFTANPVAISRNADALLSITAVSAYRDVVMGEISIRVTADPSGEPICSISFPGVKILPGANMLSRFREVVSRIFYDNELSNILRNTGTFAPASYSICCLFTPDDKILPGINNEQCFFTTITPRTPLTLVHPQDTICDFRPPFTWLGRKSSPGTSFKVVCVPMNADQSAEEALQNNPPVINQVLSRQVNQIAYPAGTPALKEGNKYAWQVLEVAGESTLNSSDIFSFVAGCSTALQNGAESFAEVKTYYTGKKYYFTSTVNFSFTNPYAATNLSYAIIHIASQKRLTNLPTIRMNAGLNRIVLQTEDIKGLQKNELYKIEIYNLATTTHYFNFIIKD